MTPNASNYSVLITTLLTLLLPFREHSAVRLARDLRKTRGGGLSKLLTDYEQQRDQCPTLDVFTPRIVSFFNDYAAK